MISNAENILVPHVLLTVLGRKPRPARYTLDDREIESQLAPVALFDLLPEEERPDRLLAVCTPEAKQEGWPLLEQALKGRCQVERIDVPSGETREDIAAYLKEVAGAISGDVELTVDVTHGFRHFSFLIYIVVFYLNALRNVRVRGAWYGLLKSEHPSPFLDLRPLLDLPDWIYALRVLHDTGSARPMAEVIRGETPNQSEKEIARDLSRLSESYLSGLPIELGRYAYDLRRSLKPLRRTLAHSHRLPLSQELADRFDETLERLALNDLSPGSGWKGRVVLSGDELERQARIVDDLLERGSLASALGLMNEWTVSWIVLRLDHESDWLDFKRVRRKAAGLLGAIGVVGKDPDLRHCLTKEQRSLGEFWRRLTQLRNAYHHHGMRKGALIGEKQTSQEYAAICKYWKETLRHRPNFSLSLGGSSGGRVLVSPVGKRPGVLFSAFRACDEDGDGTLSLCLAVCSRESEGGIAEAAGRADYKGSVECFRFEDPYGGLGEIEALVKAARHRLIGADEVLVNVTGGTTLMGLAAEKLANAARDLACPTVRRFGLVDRRPPTEQDVEPYRVGEPFWLDCAGDADAD